MKYLVIIFSLLLICGCTTEKKVVKWLDTHPESKLWEQWQTKDTVFSTVIDTIFRTDSFWTQLPAEKVTDSFLVEIPCPNVKINMGPDTLETTYARVIYGIRNNQFYIDLKNKTDPWKVRYDSAVAEIHIKDKEIIQLLTKLPAVQKPIPWYYKAALWGFFGMIFLLIVLIVILRILKKFPKL